jgi:exosome complex RNA-binding protein Rrp4
MGESQVFGPKVLSDAKRQVQMIRENLKVAQSRQKSYADKRSRDPSFDVGDFIYIKVSAMRSIRRFKVKGKLAPRYVGPFQIICHTPFREIGNEASIRVPRMFKSHAWQQYDKQMQCY